MNLKLWKTLYTAWIEYQVIEDSTNTKKYFRQSYLTEIKGSWCLKYFKN